MKEPHDTRLAKATVGIWFNPKAWRGRRIRGGRKPLTSGEVLTLATRQGVASAVVRRCVSGSQHDQVFRTSTLEIDTPRMCLIDLVDEPTRLAALIKQLTACDVEGAVVVSDSLGGNQVPQFRSGVHVQVYTWEDAKLDGRPVYQAVSDWLRERGMWWVSVTRSSAGYTGSKRPVSRRWRLSFEPTPLVVDVIDVTERLQPHLNELAAWLGDQAMMVYKDVSIAGRRDPL